MPSPQQQTNNTLATSITAPKQHALTNGSERHTENATRTKQSLPEQQSLCLPQAANQRSLVYSFSSCVHAITQQNKNCGLQNWRQFQIRYQPNRTNLSSTKLRSRQNQQFHSTTCDIVAFATTTDQIHTCNINYGRQQRNKTVDSLSTDTSTQHNKDRSEHS